MTELHDGTPLFELGQRCFAEFSSELEAYGIAIDPGMELRRGKGMLCYYDLSDGHIYLSIPELGAPMGELQRMLLGHFLFCDDEEDLTRFLQLFVALAYLGILDE
jgi:hypothetical protein